MTWLAWLVVVCAVVQSLVLLSGVFLWSWVWRRGVAHGRAQAVEQVDSSIGFLSKRVDERAAAKAAVAPADFQNKTTEEVCQWAESVVKLWKSLRQSP